MLHIFFTFDSSATFLLPLGEAVRGLLFTAWGFYFHIFQNL